MAPRTKLLVAYVGTPFSGWQRQSEQRTVQGELERALALFTGGREVAVVGAGRTDAGVHAAGQVAHCELPGRIPHESLLRGLNGILPLEIKVRSALSVGAAFHARRDARGKLYTYRVRWRPASLPWQDPRAATMAPTFDLEMLSEALRLLPGNHDWASFTVPDPGPESTVRALYRAELRQRRDGFDVEFVGSGFLRYQVRRMVGAVLEVGSGRRLLRDLRRLIEQPQPGARIQTAPAAGLCLERVYYRRSPSLDAG
jgi:tRNA pseudouridine38-40 synthase